MNYIKELIAASEYAQHKEQAEEFMQMFPAKEFTQTDVLIAFEKFECWCLIKNVLAKAGAFCYNRSGLYWFYDR